MRVFFVCGGHIVATTTLCLLFSVIIFHHNKLTIASQL